MSDQPSRLSHLWRWISHPFRVMSWAEGQATGRPPRRVPRDLTAEMLAPAPAVLEEGLPCKACGQVVEGDVLP